MHSITTAVPVSHLDIISSSSFPRQAHTHQLQFRNGQLTWTTQEGIQPLEQKDIVFILEAALSQSPQDGRTYMICLLREQLDNAENPYQLNLLLSNELPDELLRSHLLKTLPDHLKSSESNQVHVIVSTKSGTGLANSCWTSVVQPLMLLAGRNTASTGAQDQQKPRPRGEDGESQDYNVLVTESAQSVRRFARERCAARRAAASRDAKGSLKSETVVILSGDGGIVDLLNGCGEGDDSPGLPTVAILPLGTGNALFHSLHKSLYTENGPSPLVLALRTLFRGRPAPLPSFRASFSPGSRLVAYRDKSGAETSEDPAEAASRLERDDTEVDHLHGAIVASYGFHASLVWESDTPEYRKHGDKRFGMVAQELLKASHGYLASVETIRSSGSSSSTPQPINREAFGYVLATMVSNLEKTFTISPASRPLEPQLRLVHFGPVDGAKTMEIMMQAYNGGKHVDMKWTDGGGREDYVGYEAIDELKVTIREADPRWRKVCIDGTIVEVVEGGWMKVRRTGAPRMQILVDAAVL